jgi:vacuolar protein sorting-associated protein 54
MEQMRAAAVNVKKLRSRIRQLDETVVLNSLKIISCQRVQTNKCAVLEKLKLMATVHQTQPMIQLLLGTQDYVAALDLIATAQEILSQELSSIHCFRHLPSQLTEMEKLIDKMLSTDFERYSMADLNRPLSPDDTMDEQTVDDDKLISIVAGLLRQKNFTFIETYKDDVITTVRAVVKQMVIEVIATSDVELCLTGAGEEAQSLSLMEWIVLLMTATKTLLKLLKRVKLVHDLMQQTADLSAGKLGEGSENGDERDDEGKEGDDLNFTVIFHIHLEQI